MADENTRAALEIRFLGFLTITDTVFTPFKSRVYRMLFSHGNLETVEISGHAGHSDMSLMQNYLENDYLEKNRRGTLLQSLEKIPGVSGISLGRHYKASHSRFHCQPGFGLAGRYEAGGPTVGL